MWSTEGMTGLKKTFDMKMTFGYLMTSGHFSIKGEGMGVLLRREREKIQRRNDIIDAAKHVFFKRGLKAATMDQIAKRAELSKGTLYLYFKSKEELYVALLEEGITLFSDLMAGAKKKEHSPEGRIRMLLRAFYTFYAEYPHYYEIMFSLQKGELPREKISDEIYLPVQKQAAEAIKFVETEIVAGVEAGSFKPVNAFDITMIIWGMANGIFTTTGLLNDHNLGRAGEKDLLEAAADLIIGGLRNHEGMAT